MDNPWMANMFQQAVIPVDLMVTQAVDYLVNNYRPLFQAMKYPVNLVLEMVENGFRTTPPTITMAVVFLIAWQVVSIRMAIASLLLLFSIGLIGAWEPAMTSLAIVITSISFCALLGIPLGICSAKSNLFEALLKPILDFMQTIPSFVYLVPVVLLFGVGNVPGVIVTTLFALPPMVRLTNLGIREVSGDLIEASKAFGSSPVQTLINVELPTARPVIMAGLNQSVMMCLAMSVVSSMISVAGLGRMVLVGIGQLDMAQASVGGLGIVFLAIIIDRITQGLGKTKRERGFKGWYQVGPLGAVLNLRKS